jgi:hypothetical protein
MKNCPDCSYLLARLQAEIDRCDRNEAVMPSRIPKGSQRRIASASYAGERLGYERVQSWLRSLLALE